MQDIPVRKYLLIKQAEEQTQTESGLYLTEEEFIKPNIGVIIKLGEKCSEYYKEGYSVKFKKGVGLSYGENILLIDELDILSYAVETASE